MATGAVETMTVALDKVRALGRCPGRRWGGLDDARSLLLATDLGLATHHARACLLALVAEWRRHAAEVLAGAAAWGRAPGALDAVGLRRINSSSSSSSGGGGENAEGFGREVTDYGGGVVGDPRRLQRSCVLIQGVLLPMVDNR